MKYILLTIIAIAVARCTPQVQVYSDHDPDYQVADFRTFDWDQKENIEANQNPLYYNELNDKRIKAAVCNELTNRGYARSEQNPDIIIHYHIIVNDQSIVTTKPYGYVRSVLDANANRRVCVSRRHADNRFYGPKEQ